MNLLNRAKRIEAPILELLILGLLFRLIFMPISAHADIMEIAWESHYVSLGNFNIYQYFLEHFPKLLYKGDISYFPLIYYLTGLWEYILSSLHLITIDNWNSTVDVLGQWKYNPADLFNSNSAIFLLKLIYLPFDLLAGYLLLKIVDAKDRWLTFALWMLNPVIIYTAYIWGQIDIIPTSFLVLALYYAKKSSMIDRADPIIDRNAILSVLALGISACFKSFQLFLLPVFVIVLCNKNLLKSLKLGILGLIPYILCIIPFIKTPAFFQSVFLSPQAQRLFHAYMGFGYESHKIYIFFTFFFIALYYLIHFESRRSFDALWQHSFIVLSIFYMTVFWNPQWYLWVVPFLILGAIKRELYMNYYVLMMGFFFIYTASWDIQSSTGLFFPIAPDAILLQGIPNMMPSYTKVVNIAVSIFWVLSIVIIYSMLKMGSNKQESNGQESTQLRTKSSVYRNLTLIVPALVLFAALFSPLFFGTHDYIGINQSHSDGVSPGIMRNMTIGQTFISPYPGLYAIEITPAINARIKDGQIIFHLGTVSSSGDRLAGEEIATAELSASSLKNGEPFSILLPTIPDSEGKTYAFFLEAPYSDRENAIALSTANSDPYKEGFEVLNGDEVANADLKFATYHYVGIGDVINSMSIVHRDQRDSIFMVLYFISIIILAGLLAALYLRSRGYHKI